jgi:hypothetical protein
MIQLGRHMHYGFGRSDGCNAARDLSSLIIELSLKLCHERGRPLFLVSCESSPSQGRNEQSDSCHRQHYRECENDE